MTARASACASATIAVGVALRSVPQLVGRALGGHERRAQEGLELAVPDEVAFQLLQLVGEVGARAPHVLEARDRVGEEAIDLAAAIPEEAAAEAGVTELDRREGHQRLSRIALRTFCSTSRTITATIGERSIGPICGTKRRKMRRYGSHTS